MEHLQLIILDVFLLMLLLVVLLVVLEFENGSQEEEPFVVVMSQRGDFRMVVVARSALRAVRLICLMPNWLVCMLSVLVHCLSFLRYDSFAPLQSGKQRASLLNKIITARTRSAWNNEWTRADRMHVRRAPQWCLSKTRIKQDMRKLTWYWTLTSW